MSIKRLAETMAKSERIVIGLNSGTSMDGVDALCVRVKGAGLDVETRPIAFQMTPYPAPVAARLESAPDLQASEISWLDLEVGRFFAACACAVARKAGVPIEEVDLIGSHGQTVYHRGSGAVDTGAGSMQIADLDVICEVTGVPVIGDFRARDLAAGGAGAPLMPYLDWVLFHRRPRTVALNLGGVASVTGVREDLQSCTAFDVGPGNLPLDALARRLTRGEERYDPGGRLAARGVVDPLLLERLLAHPFFATPPPRTAGRELFGEAFVRELVQRHPNVELENMLATLCLLVARTIYEAVERDLGLPGGPREIVVSGGGCRNATLMGHLKRLFHPVPVTSIGEYGVDPDAKEALLFAVLANERLFENPTNVPAATGARWPVSLGKITF